MKNTKSSETVKKKAKEDKTTSKKPSKISDTKKSVKTTKITSKDTTTNKSAKKTKSSTRATSKKKKRKIDDSLLGMGIVVVDDNLSFDKEAELEEKRAYLEEARSQETFD